MKYGAGSLNRQILEYLFISLPPGCYRHLFDQKLAVYVDNWEAIGVIWSPANIFSSAHFKPMIKNTR